MVFDTFTSTTAQFSLQIYFNATLQYLIKAVVKKRYNSMSMLGIVSDRDRATYIVPENSLSRF